MIFERMCIIMDQPKIVQENANIENDDLIECLGVDNSDSKELSKINFRNFVIKKSKGKNR